MGEGWIIAIIVIAWFGGGAMGFIIACLCAASKRADECADCSYVRFYGQFLKKVASNQDVEIGKVQWFQDEIKRPSAKLN